MRIFSTEIEKNKLAAWNMDESHSYTDDWKQAKQETGNTHMGKGLATSRSRGSLVGSGNYLSSSELVTQAPPRKLRGLAATSPGSCSPPQGSAKGRAQDKLGTFSVLVFAVVTNTPELRWFTPVICTFRAWGLALALLSCQSGGEGSLSGKYCSSGRQQEVNLNQSGVFKAFQIWHMCCQLTFCKPILTPAGWLCNPQWALGGKLEQ